MFVEWIVLTSTKGLRRRLNVWYGYKGCGAGTELFLLRNQQYVVCFWIFCFLIRTDGYNKTCRFDFDRSWVWSVPRKFEFSRSRAHSSRDRPICLDGVNHERKRGVIMETAQQRQYYDVSKRIESCTIPGNGEHKARQNKCIPSASSFMCERFSNRIPRNPRATRGISTKSNLCVRRFGWAEIYLKKKTSLLLKYTLFLIARCFLSFDWYSIPYITL